MILSKKILVLGASSVVVSAIFGGVSAAIAPKTTEIINKIEVQQSQSDSSIERGEKEIEPGEIFA